ncbi:SigE family RNA polymerase sigma factor [Streptomyces sp. SID12488]|uniref:SigE family RNA polymerase sigma factor n=1 Tax=Streptomyces sp. SID12488 TaxID=2706040 RepID=UPI0013DC64F1|nr:SigE family RNA polymerase sigma factor [Streptomyces sp. SID12488]NEA62248.1 SigE family RNA polymerase sigma factor [Streptomyces sp. SID12488]
MSATVRQRDFEEYARAGRQRLYRTAYLLCGDREHARDLVQSTLARLFQHWHRASRAEHLDAYARTVLTRLFLHERRRRLRDLLAHARPDPAPAEPRPELRVTLMAALGQLPPRARTMVVLRYWEDLSVSEVAAQLRCSESTVKSQCSRSLTRLRAVLGEAHVYTAEY